MTMTEMRRKQKEEAIRRMGILEIMTRIITDFEKEDILHYSERQNALFNAILYEVTDEHVELKAKIKEFEETYGALVYHLQLTHTESGEAWTMLYVSKNEDEWEWDRQDLLNGYAYANVWLGEVTEIGSVRVKGSIGGVLRTD